MPLFDFVCSHGHATEARVTSLVPSVACPVCGEDAARVAVHRVAMVVGAGRDWTSPVRDNGRIRPPVAERKVSLRQYREATEQLEHQHHQTEESAGQKLPEPPLFKIAKQRADQLMKAGVKDSLDMPKAI